MAKTQLTLDLEMQIWRAARKQGVFGCFEVTIGWFGHERVDFMTVDTKNIWRCFEVKVSKEDFRSKNHATFVGHYNYYVMPMELYNQVKAEIPEGIGVYVNDTEEWRQKAACVKIAKKRPLAVEEKILIGSMIRSLARDAQKVVDDGDALKVNGLKRDKRQMEAEKRDLQYIIRSQIHEVLSMKSFLRSRGLYQEWRKTEDERDAGEKTEADTFLDANGAGHL